MALRKVLKNIDNVISKIETEMVEAHRHHNPRLVSDLAMRIVHMQSFKKLLTKKCD